MPNTNISTNIISPKSANTASSAKSVTDTSSDNSFKELLSSQMNSKTKVDNTEAPKAKKSEETKESADTSAEQNEVQATPYATSTNVNPVIIATVFQNTSHAELPTNETQAIIDGIDVTGKEQKPLTLSSDIPVDIDKVVNNGNEEDINTNLAMAGKSFAAITDKIKYAKPEMIDKVPQTVISNHLTTTETTDALISSLTSTASVVGTPFLQTQPIVNHTSINEVTPKFTLHSNINSYGWTGELANKLTYFVNEKLQSAQLHINPEHLGPIEVRIQIDSDKQTTIHFSALHADTRQALEMSIPQLKSILTDNGVNLANCSVNPDAFMNNMNQQHQQNQSQRNPSNAQEQDKITSSTISGQVSITGSIDLFV